MLPSLEAIGSMGESKTSDPHGNVPFSWEKNPGVSKVHQSAVREEKELLHNLPPPPYTTEAVGCGSKINGGVYQDIQNIPLPPCAFQPPFYRTSSKKGLMWMQEEDDPFFAAYKECTKKSSNKSSLLRRRVMSIFSCKRSCAVRDNNLVRISHVSERS